MKTNFNDKVYYSDTDAYGVVWHGAYLRWMEKGRILYCDELGLDLVKLAENDIVLPVSSINIKYKKPAKLNNTISVETSLLSITPVRMTFKQIIKDAATNDIFVTAEVSVVAVSTIGKLYMKLPPMLAKVINEELLCND